MDARETAREFLQRADDAVAGHYCAANEFEGCSRVATFFSMFGGVLVVVIGGVLIGDLSLSSDAIRILNLAVFAAGVIVTIISIFQAVFRWGERCRKHKDVGARYADARRRLEVLMLSEPIETADLVRWSEQYTCIGEAAELVPPHVWRKKKSMRSRGAR